MNEYARGQRDALQEAIRLLGECVMQKRGLTRGKVLAELRRRAEEPLCLHGGVFVGTSICCFCREELTPEFVAEQTRKAYEGRHDP